jgi:hypothetical protein
VWDSEKSLLLLMYIDFVGQSDFGQSDLNHQPTRLVPKRLEPKRLQQIWSKRFVKNSRSKSFHAYSSLCTVERTVKTTEISLRAEGFHADVDGKNTNVLAVDGFALAMSTNDW